VLKIRRPEQNTALNARREKPITAKISGNGLKQGSGTHCATLEQFTTAKIKGCPIKECSKTNSNLRWGSTQI